MTDSDLTRGWIWPESKKATCIAGGFEQPPRRGLKESPIQTKLDLTVWFLCLYFLLIPYISTNDLFVCSHWRHSSLAEVSPVSEHGLSGHLALLSDTSSCHYRYKYSDKPPAQLGPSRSCVYTLASIQCDTDSDRRCAMHFHIGSYCLLLDLLVTNRVSMQYGHSSGWAPTWRSPPP